MQADELHVTDIHKDIFTIGARPIATLNSLRFGNEFGESQSRLLITLSPENEGWLVNYLNSNNVSFIKLGEVKGSNTLINGDNYSDVAAWTEVCNTTLSDINEYIIIKIS